MRIILSISLCVTVHFLLAQHSELAMEKTVLHLLIMGRSSFCAIQILNFSSHLFCFRFIWSLFTKTLLAGFHNISVHPRCPCLRCPRYIYPICLFQNNLVCCPVHCLAFNAFAKSEIGVTIRVLFLTTWCMNFSPQLALIKTRFTRETNKQKCCMHLPPNIRDSTGCSIITCP